MDLFIKLKEVLKFEFPRKYKQWYIWNCSNFDCGNLVIASKIIKSELFKAYDGLLTVSPYHSQTR